MSISARPILRAPTTWEQLLVLCQQSLSPKVLEILAKIVKNKRWAPEVNLDLAISALQVCKAQHYGVLTQAIFKRIYLFHVATIRNEIKIHLKINKEAHESFDEKQLTYNIDEIDTTAKIIWNLLHLFERVRKCAWRVVPGLIIDAMKGQVVLEKQFTYLENPKISSFDTHFLKAYVQFQFFITHFATEMAIHIKDRNPKTFSLAEDGLKKLAALQIVSIADPAKLLQHKTMQFLITYYDVQAQYDCIKKIITLPETTVKELEEQIEKFDAIVNKFLSVSALFGDYPFDFIYPNVLDEKNQLTYSKTLNQLKKELAELKNGFEQRSEQTIRDNPVIFFQPKAEDATSQDCAFEARNAGKVGNN